MSQDPLTRDESSGGLESLDQVFGNKEFREQFNKMFFNEKMMELLMRKINTEESQDCHANRMPPWDESEESDESQDCDTNGLVSDESDENPRSNAFSNYLNSIQNTPAFQNLVNAFMDESQTSAESSSPPQLLSDESSTPADSSWPPQFLLDESSTPEESSCPPQSFLDEPPASERDSYADQVLAAIRTPELLGRLQKFAANPNEMVELSTLILKISNKFSENDKLEQFIDFAKDNNNDDTNNDETNLGERFFSILKQSDRIVDVLASAEFEEVSEPLLAGIDRETIKRNKNKQWTFIREKLDCTGTNAENKIFSIFTSEKMAHEVAELTPIAKQYKNATTEDEKREIRETFFYKFLLMRMNEACNENTDNAEVSGAAAATATV